MNAIYWIGSHWSQVGAVALATQVLAKAVVTLFPNPKADTLLAKVTDFVTAVGGLIPHPKV